MLGQVEEDIFQIVVRKIFHMITAVGDGLNVNDVAVIVIQFRGGGDGQIGLVGAGTRDKEDCDEGEDD